MVISAGLLGLEQKHAEECLLRGVLSIRIAQPSVRAAERDRERKRDNIDSNHGLRSYSFSSSRYYILGALSMAMPYGAHLRSLIHFL